MYKYEEKAVLKAYENDKLARIELFKSNNYDRLKSEVKKTRKSIKDLKVKNKTNKDYYLKLINQISNLKENISKTDKKIINIEKEYKNFGGIKPEFVSSITISELNVLRKF